MKPQRLYEISELEELTGLSADEIREAIHAGRLRARRPGGPKGRFRIAEEDYIAWMEASLFIPDVDEPVLRVPASIRHADLELVV